MRILLFTQYFTPEITAAPVRLDPFAAGLAARGHDVEVICEVPSHPRGVVEPGYGGRLVDRRTLEGFDATYVRTHVTGSRRAAHRLASYASYAAMASAVGSLRRRPDVVLASSPPLSVGAVGALVAFRHRVPFVLDVRDLWPEAAVVFGELGEGRALAAAERLERWLYKRAARVTTPTEPFRAHIAARAEDPGKVAIVANGTTPEWIAVADTESARPELGLPQEKFVWTYAGNIGLSQDLGTAVAAAEELGEGFELVIVGEGTSRPQLEDAISGLEAGSVRMVGLVPPSEAARYMRSSDALLVPLADEPALGKSIPIKLYDCCAVGRPVIVAAPGEPRRIAEEAGAALTVQPGDPGGLARAVRELRDDPQKAERLAGRAAEFAARSLRERGVEELERLLRDLTRIAR